MIQSHLYLRPTHTNWRPRVIKGGEATVNQHHSQEPTRQIDRTISPSVGRLAVARAVGGELGPAERRDQDGELAIADHLQFSSPHASQWFSSTGPYNFAYLSTPPASSNSQSPRADRLDKLERVEEAQARVVPKSHLHLRHLHRPCRQPQPSRRPLSRCIVVVAALVYLRKCSPDWQLRHQLSIEPIGSIPIHHIWLKGLAWLVSALNVDEPRLPGRVEASRPPERLGPLRLVRRNLDLKGPIILALTQINTLRSQEDRKERLFAVIFT